MEETWPLEPFSCAFRIAPKAVNARPIMRADKWIVFMLFCSRSTEKVTPSQVPKVCNLRTPYVCLMHSLLILQRIFYTYIRDMNVVLRGCQTVFLVGFVLSSSLENLLMCRVFGKSMTNRLFSFCKEPSSTFIHGLLSDGTDGPQYTRATSFYKCRAIDLQTIPLLSRPTPLLLDNSKCFPGQRHTNSR